MGEEGDSLPVHVRTQGDRGPGARPAAPDDPARGALWRVLRGKALDGLRFRRQHPIGSYVLDFYCEAAALCVEVDGQRHWLGRAQERDADRDAWLAARGIRTLRLSASLVLEDMDAALRAIAAEARRRPPPSSPVGGGGPR